MSLSRTCAPRMYLGVWTGMIDARIYYSIGGLVVDSHLVIHGRSVRDMWALVILNSLFLGDAAEDTGAIKF